jgi:hypothetical protein
MLTRNDIFFILRPRYKNTTYFFQLRGIALQFVSVTVPGYNILWGVVAVIVWKLDLQLPMQSVPITTDVVSSNLDQGEV